MYLGATVLNIAGKGVLASLFMFGAVACTPVTAAQLDGAWECRSFGILIATIGIKNDDYVLANTRGPSGRGTLADASGTYDVFIVEDGPLLENLRMVGGTFKVDREEPMLTLVSDNDVELYCYLK